MTISKELLDELLKGCERPEDLLGDAGLMKELKIRLMERMPGARADRTSWLWAWQGRTRGTGQPASKPMVLQPAPPSELKTPTKTAKLMKGQDPSIWISLYDSRIRKKEP